MGVVRNMVDLGKALVDLVSAGVGKFCIILQILEVFPHLTCQVEAGGSLHAVMPCHPFFPCHAIRGDTPARRPAAARRQDGSYEPMVLPERTHRGPRSARPTTQKRNRLGIV